MDSLCLSADIRQLFQSELLFCEITYLDCTDDEQRRNMASERGHIAGWAG